MESWDGFYAANMQVYEGYSIGKQLAMINDPEVISLAGGLPSPDTFLKSELREFTRECFQNRLDRVMQYSPIRGEPELIEAVRGYLQREGVQVGPENILITSSGQQGLDLVGRLCLDPGDAVVVERPTFAGALAAFRMQCPEFLGVDLASDGMDMDQLQSVLEQRQAQGRRPKFVYVVPDFQNPSGITMSLAKREALLDLCERHQVPVVEDSPYRSLRYEGQDVPSLLQLDQERGSGMVIEVQTFSKLFCPGMRVGFNVGPPEVMAKMTNIKEGGTLNTPKYNQDMCTAFLTRVDLDTYFESCRSVYRHKLEVFLEAMAGRFADVPGMDWTRPEGGLFVWVTVPEDVCTGELFQTALESKVAFVPGEVCFGENPELRHLRVNFSYPQEDRLLEAVDRLGNSLERHRSGLRS